MEFSRPVAIAAPISEIAAAEGPEALDPRRIGYEVMERLRATDRAQVWMRRREFPRNALYDQGEHDIRFDGTALSWTRKTRDKRINRQKADLLGVRGDHWVADLTQGMPDFVGLPENRDVMSRRRGKLGERLMKADWRRCNLDLARSLATRSVWRFGTGFIESCWDPEAGPIKPQYQMDQGPVGDTSSSLALPRYQRAPDGARLSSGYKAAGAVVARAISPFLVYVPITTEIPMMEACAWVIRLEWATKHQILSMADQTYVGDLPNGFPLDDDMQFRYTDDLLARVGSGERREQASEAMGLHLVVHYYELRKAIEGFTEGAHCIVSSEQCIRRERLQGWGEARGDRYPIFNYSGRPRERTFWSQPEINSRIDPQRRRNQILTHEIAYLGRFAMPTPLASKGSEVPDTIPFDGTTVHYNDSHPPPTVLSVPTATPGLFQLKDATVREMDEAGGDEPASRGVAVSAPSARYVQYLQDAAAKRIGPLARQHAWSWARMGELHCQLHADNEPDEQILTVIGHRNRPELVSLRADELGSVQFHVLESSLSGSIPSARIEQLQMAVPTMFGPPPPGGYPPQLLRAFLKFIDMPDAMDLETGTSALDDWVDGIVTRAIDEGQDPEVELASLEMEELDALKQGLIRRKYEGDFFDWGPEEHQRYAMMKMAIEQALAPMVQAQEEAQDKMAAKQVEMQLALERGKQQAQADKGIRVAYGRERAGSLRDLVTPVMAGSNGAPAPREATNGTAQ